jgi:hypothetical protein
MVVDLAELQETQQELQYGKGDGTDRSRSIDEISEMIGFFVLDSDFPGISSGIKGLLERYIAEKGHVVWADFGCGNAFALRQGKMHLESVSIDPDKLKAYGVDVLPVVDEEVAHTIDYFKRRDGLDFDNIMDAKYAPVLISDDITTVRLPERPDIVTCCEVLMWAYDPLMAFANAASQAEIGATLGFNRLNNILVKTRFDTMGHQGNLFRHIITENSGFPGFQIYDECYALDELLLKKTSEQDFTYGFKKLNDAKAYQGITHVYVKK